jgi:competence protein ComEC
VVAVSHAHEDHIGGLDAVLENFRPEELWTGAGGLHRRGVRVRALKRGDAFEFGGARIEALSPSGAGAANPNDDSLALRITYRERSALLTGDIERRVERELAAGGLARADILKVAHHGSRTSTTPDLLDAARPSFAIISAGYENPYGHPHRDVLSRLAARGVATLRTDALGLVTIRTDGRRIEIGAARWSGQSGALAAVWSD